MSCTIFCKSEFIRNFSVSVLKLILMLFLMKE
jgi:hypothetical protein